jgi:hypothetical protein
MAPRGGKERQWVDHAGALEPAGQPDREWDIVTFRSRTIWHLPQAVRLAGLGSEVWNRCSPRSRKNGGYL